MRIAVAFLFLLAARPGGDGPYVRDTYLPHLAKGDQFYRAFDNERALDEYQRAYSLAPDSFATLERLVSIYNDMVKTQASQRYFLGVYVQDLIGLC